MVTVWLQTVCSEPGNILSVDDKGVESTLLPTLTMSRVGEAGCQGVSRAGFGLTMLLNVLKQVGTSSLCSRITI